MTDKSPMIVFDSVAKAFNGKNGPFFAVENIGLAVQEGEFVSVVGPSGCGKSTILNMVSGLMKQTAGDIYVANQKVDGIQSDIGYLFQKDALLPWKTLRQNIRLPLVFRNDIGRDTEQRVDYWLSKVGLGGFGDHYPHQLSGGMRKRAALAAVFIYNPRILLMDEPFSALDVQTRNLMENELLDLWTEHKKTVVFITHDLEEAISLSDRIVVMTAGPGTTKAEYAIDLPRPRNVNEIRLDPRFASIFAQIWSDLKEEVEESYQRQMNLKEA